jgi:SAM-dependent methyltransferase
VGVDVDPKAAALALHRGLDKKVLDINILANSPAFNGITLSHIIEHVHDPVAVITRCYRLLKPGGWLWLETPNIDSQKHPLYGENWRGLEAPRHLILFNNNSLRFLLSTTGFEHIEPLPYRSVCRGVFGQSAAFAKLAGCVPITNYEPPESLAKTSDKKVRTHHDISDIGEFISMRAWKPSS